MAEGGRGGSAPRHFLAHPKPVFTNTPLRHPLFLRTASRAPRTLAACLSGHRLSPAIAPLIHADLTQSEAQGAADATFCPWLWQDVFFLFGLRGGRTK